MDKKLSVSVKVCNNSLPSAPIAALGADSNKALKLLTDCALLVLPVALLAPLLDPALGKEDTSNALVNTDCKFWLVSVSVTAGLGIGIGIGIGSMGGFMAGAIGTNNETKLAP